MAFVHNAINFWALMFFVLALATVLIYGLIDFNGTVLTYVSRKNWWYICLSAAIYLHSGNQKLSRVYLSLAVSSKHVTTAYNILRWFKKFCGDLDDQADATFNSTARSARHECRSDNNYLGQYSLLLDTRNRYWLEIWLSSSVRVSSTNLRGEACACTSAERTRRRKSASLLREFWICSRIHRIYANSDLTLQGPAWLKAIGKRRWLASLARPMPTAREQGD